MNESRAKECLRVTLALIAGFVGGAFHSGAVPAVEASDTVLHGSRFVLTNNAGRTVAYWGTDSSGQNPSLHFLNPTGVEVLVVGLQGSGSPTLNIMGGDAKVRATLRLEGVGQKPILGMGDERWEGRVMLGFMQPDVSTPSWDQWGLVFRAPQGATRIASLAAVRDPTTGQISARMALLEGC